MVSAMQMAITHNEPYRMDYAAENEFLTILYDDCLAEKLQQITTSDPYDKGN